jgi:hypothetical protein
MRGFRRQIYSISFSLSVLIPPTAKTSLLIERRASSMESNPHLSSQPRLRGGMGVGGGVGGKGAFGMTHPQFCEKYDGNPDNCKCPPGCRCGHCNIRTGYSDILKSRYPRPRNLSSYGRAPYPTPCGVHHLAYFHPL